MSQVLGNLMTNAVESIVAAGRGSGRLSISLSRVVEAGAGTEKIIIADDGVGFEPETAAGLFERGHTSKMGDSNGLGLHWCANAVKALGGSLQLESDGPGKGARAIILLRDQQAEAGDKVSAAVLAA